MNMGLYGLCISITLWFYFVFLQSLEVLYDKHLFICLFSHHFLVFSQVGFFFLIVEL